jgi:hypothetical protein
MVEKLGARATSLAALFLGFMLPAALAAGGDDPVGTATLVFQDQARGRQITTELWFRAAADAQVEW